MSSKLVISGLLLAYASLLAVTGIADWQGRLYNDVEGGNRDGYNPRFDPGNYQTPDSLPVLFPSTAHLALAEQAAVDGKIAAARHHAFDALHQNPANGEAALLLLDLYARPAMYRIELDDTEYDVEAEELQAKQPAAAEQVYADEDDSEVFGSISNADKLFADKAADLSYHLRPTYLATLGTLAEYWSAHNQDEKSFRVRSVLLVNNPESAERTFPLFHAALDDPRFNEFFAQQLQSPSVWWPAFFNYLLTNETDADKIQQYYLARAHSANPPTPSERDSYVSHLLKNGHWSKAYQVWADNLGIPATAIAQLYDGGFEDIKNINQAFTWNLSSPALTVKVQQVTGMGVTGKRALHITFKKGSKSTNFQHVSQTRLLPAGEYTLKGRYRLAQLRTSKGLRWRVHCTDKPELGILGESDAFKGHSVWQDFQFDIQIPGDCHAQTIRLESDSPYAHHNVFEGETWFDDLTLISGSAAP